MSDQPRDYLTATDFYTYVTCPHWPYYDRFATSEERALKRELTEGEQKRLNDGYLHEQDVMTQLFGDTCEIIPDDVSPERCFSLTKQWMRQGAECIYQGTLLHGDWQGRPDILQKVPGQSLFGNWHYIPIDIKSAHSLKPEHRFQLTFYSVLLKHIQGVFPEKAGIINRDKEPFHFDPSDVIQDFSDILEKIEAIRRGEKPLPVLRKSCFDTGPWGKACQAYAESQSDIALLYNVDVKKIQSLRSLGIRTINQVADMDIREYAGQAPFLTAHGLEAMQLQARSLLTESVFVRKPVHLPDTSYEIHFDIESDLPNDVDYLYGFLTRTKLGDSYTCFVAEKPEDEAEMWAQFLAWIESLPSEYVVYHYAPYEPMRLGLLESRYGGSKWLNLFLSRFVDLKPFATKHIVFPLYFYSLKKIGNEILGYHWRSNTKSGGESIDVYEKWLETGNRDLLNDILLYNEDDVRATAALKDWLVSNAKDIGEFSKPWRWRKE